MASQEVHINSTCNGNSEHTTIDSSIPYSSHSVSGSHRLTKWEVNSRVREPASSPSKSLRSPVHLGFERLMRYIPSRERLQTYFGHQPWTIPASMTCSG